MTDARDFHRTYGRLESSGYVQDVVAFSMSYFDTGNDEYPVVVMLQRPVSRTHLGLAGGLLAPFSCAMLAAVAVLKKLNEKRECLLDRRRIWSCIAIGKTDRRLGKERSEREEFKAKPKNMRKENSKANTPLFVKGNIKKIIKI